MDPIEEKRSAIARPHPDAPESKRADSPVPNPGDAASTAAPGIEDAGDAEWQPGFKLVDFDSLSGPAARPVEPESGNATPPPAELPPLWPRPKPLPAGGEPEVPGTAAEEWKPDFNWVDFDSPSQPVPRQEEPETATPPSLEIPPLWPRRETPEAPATADPAPPAEAGRASHFGTWVPGPEPPVPRRIARPALDRRSRQPAADSESALPASARAVPQKLGIVGGKGVGKSYLFQAMVYRTYSNALAGSLAYYLDRGGIRLYTRLSREESESAENIERFIENFSSWNRLPQTLADTQRWFRLRLPYRTGWLGRGRSMLDVEFLDGSGEGFFALEHLDDDYRQLWREAYLDARIMVFCLPLWVAFPGPDLNPEDRRERNLVLKQFEQVIENYRQLRDAHESGHPVRSILALTMADDRRSALVGLRDRWVTPYMNAPGRFLTRLRRGSGVAAYLANARRVSEGLQAEFDHSHNPRVSGIPNRLDFGGGRPWLIPLSAIDGKTLEHIEAEYPDPDERQAMDLHPPAPVHVELPLLVALCERENALM